VNNAGQKTLSLAGAAFSQQTSKATSLTQPNHDHPIPTHSKASGLQEAWLRLYQSRFPGWQGVVSTRAAGPIPNSTTFPLTSRRWVDHIHANGQKSGYLLDTRHRATSCRRPTIPSSATPAPHAVQDIVVDAACQGQCLRPPNPPNPYHDNDRLHQARSGRNTLDSVVALLLLLGVRFHQASMLLHLALTQNDLSIGQPSRRLKHGRRAICQKRDGPCGFTVSWADVQGDYASVWQQWSKRASH